MKRSLIAGLLSATVLASMAVPSVAETLTSNPMAGERPIVRVMAGHPGAEGKALHSAQADFDRAGRDGEPQRPHHGERSEKRGHHRENGPGPVQRPHELGIHLAGKLAAAEVYVGIEAGQEDAWRAYTSALIGFVDGMGPGAHGREPGRQPGPGVDEPAPPAGRSRPEGPQPGTLFAERIADRAIEQGEKARTLKEAAEALRSALDDEQLARLARAEQAFVPGPGMRGPHDGPHGRPGPQDRGPHHEGPRGPAQQPAED